MAESVDAPVSNTGGAIHPGSIPGPGTQNKPTITGRMPEWSIGAVSKTVVPLREPRVRIPVLPQKTRMKPAAGQRVSFVLHLHPPAPGRGTGGQRIQWPSGSYLPPFFA